jgi:hypothetical protein
LVGADQAYSTGGYEDQEYTLVLPGKPVHGGRRSFDLVLPDAVRKTWGKHGLVFEGVTILRLRSRSGDFANLFLRTFILKRRAFRLRGLGKFTR